MQIKPFKAQTYVAVLLYLSAVALIISSYVLIANRYNNTVKNESFASIVRAVNGTSLSKILEDDNDLFNPSNNINETNYKITASCPPALASCISSDGVEYLGNLNITNTSTNPPSVTSCSKTEGNILQRTSTPVYKKIDINTTNSTFVKFGFKDKISNGTLENNTIFMFTFLYDSKNTLTGITDTRKIDIAVSQIGTRDTDKTTGLNIPDFQTNSNLNTKLSIPNYINFNSVFSKTTSTTNTDMTFLYIDYSNLKTQINTYEGLSNTVTILNTSIMPMANNEKSIEIYVENTSTKNTYFNVTCTSTIFPNGVDPTVGTPTPIASTKTTIQYPIDLSTPEILDYVLAIGRFTDSNNQAADYILSK